MDRRKRTNNPEEVRRRIVDAGFRAFVAHGYTATGMQELRQDAQVSGGAMAHHFPVKRDLGLAVIRDRVGEAVRETWIAPLERHETARAAIDAVFSAIVADLRQRQAVTGCPVNNMAMDVSPHDPQMREALSHVFQEWQSALAEKFAADLAAGRARDLDPQQMAAFVIAAYSGAMAMARTLQDVAPLAGCRAEVSSYLGTKYRVPEGG